MGQRPRLLRFALSCLLLSTSSGLMAGLEYHPVFRLLDVADGLPDQYVEAIVQDVHGFVWIGTRGGLVRHEGRELRVLPRDPQAPGALPDNNIMSLHAHSEGPVWAGVASHGVVEIGSDLLPRRHLAPAAAGGILPHANVWSMTEDCEGRLWMLFMQGGLARFDPRSEELLIIDQDESHGLVPDDFQFQIEVDRDCQVWVAQFSQVAVMDPSAPAPVFRAVVTDPTGNAPTVSLLFHSKLGLLVSRGTELLVVDPPTTASLDGQPRLLMSLEAWITGLAELPDERLAIATISGLVLFDGTNGTIEHVNARPDLSDGLPVDQLSGGTLVDREGGLWMAVAARGLAYLPPEHAVFSRFQRNPAKVGGSRLQGISTVNRGMKEDVFWIGANSIVQRLDLNSGKVEDAEALFADWPRERFSVRGLAERADGLLLLDFRKLSLFRRAPERSEILIDAAHHQDASMSFLFSEDPENAWVGFSTLGLGRFHYSSRQLSLYGPDEDFPRSLPETAPVGLRFDPEGQLVLAGEQRLYRYRPEQGFELVAELGPGRIADLAFAPDGSLWVAQDAGLSQWQWERQEVRHLADFDIGSMVERASLRQVFPRRADEVWLVLSHGLARLNPQTGLVRTFKRADGLPQAAFVPRSSVGLEDGRIVVGESLGLLVVNPDNVREDRPAPPVHLTRVSAADLDQVLVPGQRPALALGWRQNSVRFEFSALTYVAPERVLYRVRLHGWDEDWIQFQERGQMYYSNLPRGRYRFQVQAGTEGGVWNEAGDELSISIDSAPWASPAAFSAYASLLLLIVVAGWDGLRRSRHRQLQLQDVQQKRALAEGQRRIIERLNEDLEPIPLARAIMAEIRELTAAQSVCFGYVHEQMPLELLSAPDTSSPPREDWLGALQAVDDQRSHVVELEADREPVAKVLLRAPSTGFAPDHEQRLALLVDLAGQALHNSLLLQRVKRLAESAEAASQAKSDFLATMSHEIRTPLHGVMGMADLIHESETDASRDEWIDTLRASGRQLQRIIDDVLDLSCIEAGRLRLKQEPFELVSWLEQILDLHAPNAARKHLDLRLLVQSDLPVLTFGDPDRLAQILGNLINNAIKFTERGAVELSIGLDLHRDLVFIVRDSGPGITESERARLFQPFTQLDGSIRRTHGGSGLGLAICRRLAESMGGDLRLESSRWPGSSFRLSLPNDIPPINTPLSTMMQGMDVVALTDAPTYRVLLRLSRRWGFRLHCGWRSDPRSDALLLVDPRAPRDLARAEAWLAASARGLYVESPRPRTVTLLRPSGYRCLRWPIQEGRLIGALLDQVLGDQC